MFRWITPQVSPLTRSWTARWRMRCCTTRWSSSTWAPATVARSPKRRDAGWRTGCSKTAPERPGYSAALYFVKQKHGIRPAWRLPLLCVCVLPPGQRSCVSARLPRWSRWSDTRPDTWEASRGSIPEREGRNTTSTLNTAARSSRRRQRPKPERSVPGTCSTLSTYSVQFRKEQKLRVLHTEIFFSAWTVWGCVII